MKVFIAFLIALAVVIVGTAVYRYFEPALTHVDRRVKADINGIATHAEVYKWYTGNYPTTAEGFSALNSRPPDAPPYWREPFPEVPTDPWGSPYGYRFPSTSDPKTFEVFSLGPDRVESKDDVRLVRRQ